MDQRDPTLQRDPDRPSVIREERGWSMLPLILGGLALFLGAYMLFGPTYENSPTPRPTGIERNPTNVPGPSMKPTQAPTPTPTPKN